MGPIVDVKMVLKERLFGMERHLAVLASPHLVPFTTPMECRGGSVSAFRATLARSNGLRIDPKEAAVKWIVRERT